MLPDDCPLNRTLRAWRLSVPTIPITVRAAEVTRTKPLGGAKENAVVRFSRGGESVGTL